MKKVLLSIMSSLMLIMGFSMSAQAGIITLDFLNDDPNGADIFGERGVADGTILEFEGIYAQFFATSTANPAGGYAYFDGGGGLGACSTLDGDQCDVASDSALSSGETLSIYFFADAGGSDPLELVINELVFRDADHDLIDSYSYLFGVDGGGMIGTAMNGGASDSGTSFTFGYDGQAYYISSMVVSSPRIASAIPEPATWPIMIIGLASLAGTARRKRHSAIAPAA